MHAPAGLKLNQPLVDFLARFYFYHIYLWSGYLEVLLTSVSPYLYQVLYILCFFGISLAIGAICDLIRLLTIHLYCFYIYSARYHLIFSSIFLFKIDFDQEHEDRMEIF